MQTDQNEIRTADFNRLTMKNLIRYVQMFPRSIMRKTRKSIVCLLPYFVQRTHKQSKQIYS